MKPVRWTTKVSCMEITAQQFIDLGKNRSIGAGTRAAFAALLAVAIAVTVAQPGRAVGFLVLLVCLAGCAVVWWKAMRRPGERFNNYDPLKTDVEAQRTATNWREEMRLLGVVVSGFFLVNIGRIWPGWGTGLIVGLIGFALFYSLLGRQMSRPQYYTPPEDLLEARHGSAGGEHGVEEKGTAQEDAVLARGPEALIAGVYALLLVPGGFQMHNAVMVKILSEKLRASEADINNALAQAKKSGDVVTIRELRSRDDALEWVTLSPKSSHQFQERIKNGQ